MTSVARPHYKILWMPYVWPEPESSAAGLRTWGLVDAVLGAGHEVVMASACRPNAAMEQVKARGLRAEVVTLNDPAFDAFLLEVKPDIVVFERFQTEERFGWRVEKILPQALRVIDTSDLHFLRRAREMNPVLARDFPEQAAEADFLRELGSIFRSDLSYLISDFEERLLRDRYGVSPELLQTIRLSYPKRKAAAPSFSERAGFMFIGGFRHAPNADAVSYLHQELWPRIRKKLPEAELRIFGSYPPQMWMERDQSKTGFRVLGSAVSSIAELQRSRVNLAPLRFGAGLKGKISDGWQAGTPVVTTPIGAEGMCGELPLGGIAVSETDPDAFAEAAVQLYQDEKIWREHVHRGSRILDELYDPSKNAEALLVRLEASMNRRDELRKKNFIGAILRQNGARSTEYFSRWIELKEKTAARGEVKAST